MSDVEVIVTEGPTVGVALTESPSPPLQVQPAPSLEVSVSELPEPRVEVSVAPSTTVEVALAPQSVVDVAVSEAPEAASVKVAVAGPAGPQGLQGPQGIRGPQGPEGARGDAFQVDATGHTSERSLYDSQPEGFSFVDIDLGLLYFRSDPTAGAWSDGIPFGRGPEGPQGPEGPPGLGIEEVTHLPDDSFTRGAPLDGYPQKVSSFRVTEANSWELEGEGELEAQQVVTHRHGDYAIQFVSTLLYNQLYYRLWSASQNAWDFFYAVSPYLGNYVYRPTQWLRINAFHGNTPPGAYMDGISTMSVTPASPGWPTAGNYEVVTERMSGLQSTGDPLEQRCFQRARLWQSSPIREYVRRWNPLAGTTGAWDAWVDVSPNLFIGATQPSGPGPYLWVETRAGGGISFWVEDGA